jgi:hypothetical protein
MSVRHNRPTVGVTPLTRHVPIRNPRNLDMAAVALIDHDMTANTDRASK